MSVKRTHLRYLKTCGKGTVGGSLLVRLEDGTVEKRFYIDDGYERRIYGYHRQPIESLGYKVCAFQEDRLLFPNTEINSTYMWYGLTYVCDVNRHLVCWPYSVQNLHLMARRLDLKRCWFHKTHYDIPKRRLMLTQQCAVVRSRTIVEIIRGSIGAIAPDVAQSWQTLVASCAAQDAIIS